MIACNEGQTQTSTIQSTSLPILDEDCRPGMSIDDTRKNHRQEIGAKSDNTPRNPLKEDDGRPPIDGKKRVMRDRVGRNGSEKEVSKLLTKYPSRRGLGESGKRMSTLLTSHRGDAAKISVDVSNETKDFLDSLLELFECRGALDRKAEDVDKDETLRSIDLLSHSGGLKKPIEEAASGVSILYKEEYQQQNVYGEKLGTRSQPLDGLYEAAEEARKEFSALLDKLEVAVGAERCEFETHLAAKCMYKFITMLHDTNSCGVILPDLKSRDRVIEKAKDEYNERRPGPPESWLHDVNRTSVVCSTVEQMKQVITWLENNTHIVTAKNRFSKPSISGYRDMLFVIRLDVNGRFHHMCEIQLHHCEVWILNKEVDSHKHYRYFRSYFNGGDEETMARRMDVGRLNRRVNDLHNKPPEMRLALRLYKRLLALPVHQDPLALKRVARWCTEIGLLRLDACDYKRAITWLQKGLELNKIISGTDLHPGSAICYNNIGLALAKMLEFDKALHYLEQCLEITKHVNGERHLSTASCYFNIGWVHDSMGGSDKAGEYFQKSIEILESSNGKKA